MHARTHSTNRSLAFLYAVEEKLKDVYMNSSYNTSANTDTFRGSMTFYVPATEFEQHIRDSPIWKLGNVGRRSEMCGHTANGGLGLLGRGGGAGSGSLEEDGVCGECGECEDGEGEKVVNGGGEEEGEEEEEEEDGPENLLLKTKYLTDPGSRETEELRAWASSAPEMKDVSFEYHPLSFHLMTLTLKHSLTHTLKHSLHSHSNIHSHTHSDIHSTHTQTFTHTHTHTAFIGHVPGGGKDPQYKRVLDNGCFEAPPHVVRRCKLLQIEPSEGRERV